MANAWYLHGLEAIADGAAVWGTSTFKCMLVRSTGTTTYAYYTADTTAHDFLADIPDNTACRVGTAQTLANCATPTSDGCLDADDCTFVSVSSGDAIQNIVIYREGTADADSHLICIFDPGTGLPVTPDGNNITVQWATASPFIAKL